MVRRLEPTFLFRTTAREQFIKSISQSKQDLFAKTFVAKADYQGLWPATGCFIDGALAGAIIWTLSKRAPVVANLQLLHTFANFRRRGVATALCSLFLDTVISAGAEYWRVSAEPSAVVFYEKLGIKFLGRQKSGCSLCIAKVSSTFDTCVQDLNDPVIAKAVFKKGKGGCVEVYKDK